MLKVDLSVMDHELQQLRDEEIVPTAHLNAYLCAAVIVPVMDGCPVRYGDLDYDQFDDLDIQMASEYCDALGDRMRELARLSAAISDLDACAIKRRAFC